VAFIRNILLLPWSYGYYSPRRDKLTKLRFWFVRPICISGGWPSKNRSKVLWNSWNALFSLFLNFVPLFGSVCSVLPPKTVVSDCVTTDPLRTMNLSEWQVISDVSRKAVDCQWLQTRLPLIDSRYRLPYLSPRICSLVKLSSFLSRTPTNPPLNFLVVGLISMSHLLLKTQQTNNCEYFGVGSPQHSAHVEQRHQHTVSNERAHSVASVVSLCLMNYFWQVSNVQRVFGFWLHVYNILCPRWAPKTVMPADLGLESDLENLVGGRSCLLLFERNQLDK